MIAQQHQLGLFWTVTFGAPRKVHPVTGSPKGFSSVLAEETSHALCEYDILRPPILKNRVDIA